MKKLMTVLLILAMLLSAFTACANTANNAETTVDTQQETQAPETADAVLANTPTESQESAQMPEPAKPSETGGSLVTYPITDEPVTLTYWTTWIEPFNAFFTLEDVVAFKEAAKATNINIEFRTAPIQSGEEMLNLLIATGDYPDIIYEFAPLYAGGVDSAIEEGIIIKLNDLLDTCLPDYMAVVESNQEYAKSAITDGGNYGVVCTLYADPWEASMGPIIRQDWLDDLGLSAPVTYEDFTNVLTAFKTEKNASVPLLDVGTSNKGNYFAAGFGVATLEQNLPPMYQVDGVVKFGPAEPGFKDYVTLMNQWYTDGLLNPDFYVFETGESRSSHDSLIFSGQTGLFIEETSTFPYYEAQAQDPNFKISAVADAVQSPGDKNHLMVNQALYRSGTAISTSCKYPELAAKWLNYFYTDEGILLANYGVEHQGFEYNAQGEPELTDLVLNNPDIVSNITLAMYTHFNLPCVIEDSRRFTTYTEEQSAAAGIWSSRSDNSWAYPAAATLTVDETEQYVGKSTDITTYCKENIAKFITGDKPISEFDSFVEQLYAMDLDTCIKIKQDSLDRYNNR